DVSRRPRLSGLRADTARRSFLKSTMIIRSFASGGRVLRGRTCARLSVAIQSLAVGACIPYPLPVDYFHRNFRLRAFRLGWSLRRRPHRRGDPVEQHSSSFEKQAPPAKSLNPARPVGTVAEGSGGEAGPWSRLRRNSSRR